MTDNKNDLRMLEILIGGRFLRDRDLKSMGMSKRPEVSDEKREKAIALFIGHCFSDSAAAEIIESNNVSKQTIREIVADLEEGGAAHWIKGSYVPLGAITNGKTLGFILEARRRGVFNIIIINQLLGYFDGITEKLFFPDVKTK